MRPLVGRKQLKTCLLPFALATMLMPAVAATHTFCSILKNGPAFNGKTVHFQSRYLTNPLHGAPIFVSNKCKGMLIETNRDGDGDESVRAFFKELPTDLPSELIVEVTGIYHWHKHWRSEIPEFFNEKPGPQGVIRLTHVWNYRILPLHCEHNDRTCTDD